MNILVNPPENIPISVIKLEEYLNKEYKIKLKIDENFVFNVLDDKYDYHIYKKGKNKGKFKIYKSKNKDKNVKKELLSKYNFEENKKKLLPQKNDEKKIEKYECNICLNNDKKENLKKTLDFIESKYNFLYFDFYDLEYKYKSICEISKTMIFNLKKIYKLIINNNDIKKDYMDILKILNKIILQERAINIFLSYN